MTRCSQIPRLAVAGVLATGLVACTYGGEPLTDGHVAAPDGQYDYLEGQVPYDTPAMTEGEARLVEEAGSDPAAPAGDGREKAADPALGTYDETLFDREPRDF